jgi:hypothetical protein
MGRDRLPDLDEFVRTYNKVWESGGDYGNLADHFGFSRREVTLLVYKIRQYEKREKVRLFKGSMQTSPIFRKV